MQAHRSLLDETKVYIETSVISYLTARPSRDVVVAGRQAITNEWWNEYRTRFDLFISELVEEEISQGDPEAAAFRAQKVSGIESLLSSDEAENLAEVLLGKGAVPLGSEEDAVHIAIASAQGMDYLLTWKFKHINNAEMRMKISAVVESCGLVCPQLCSPEELGGIQNEEGLILTARDRRDRKKELTNGNGNDRKVKP